jgi:predicted metal-binding protein
MDMKTRVEKIISEHGYKDYVWMKPPDFVVSQWVRMKCIYGCEEYGRCAACPPHVPPVRECRQFFDEYAHAVVLHFQKKLENPEDRHAWSREVNLGLLDLEKSAFKAGFHKAFLLFMDNCGLCKHCKSSRDECKRPRSSRPTPEGLAVDVFATVRKMDLPIEVLDNYQQTMNRYAFLLIE